MSHYKPIFDPATEEWYFTSPAGRHAGRSSVRHCQSLIVAILPKHIEKANNGGAEGQIFFDYFITLAKPPTIEGAEPEQQTTRPPAPQKCNKPFRNHRWVGDGPHSSCGRCGLNRSAFDLVNHRIEEWRKRTNIHATAP